jgi:hypothetical protein
MSNSASLAPSSRSTFSSNLRSDIAAISSGHFASAFAFGVVVVAAAAAVAITVDDDDDDVLVVDASAAATVAGAAGAAARAADSVDVAVEDDAVFAPRCSFCFSICFFNFDLYRRKQTTLSR